MALNCIELSIQDWISVPDNPRQRNTEKRASTARKGHLSRYSPIHRLVFAATIKGDIICKLDGHTRALLWSLGQLDQPLDGRVVVYCIDVKNMEEAKEIYIQLDAPPATKKPSDYIYGALREIKIHLDSHLLRSCSFGTQLKIATTGNKLSGDVFSMTRQWKNELVELDHLMLTSNYTRIIGIMLLAIRRDGIVKAGEFFGALDRNEGTKNFQGADGVQMLYQHIETRRAEGSMDGYSNVIDICERSWAAYESWISKKRYKPNAGLKISKRIQDILEEVGGVQCQ